MKQLMAMLAGTADGAFVLDRNGKVAFWNHAAERIMGFKAAEVLGRHCHDVMRGLTLEGHVLCSPSCPIAERLTAGTAVRNFDMQTRTKRGRLIWLNISSLPIRSRTPPRYTAAHLFRDVTKQAKIRQLVDELHTSVCCPLSAVSLPMASVPPDISLALPLSTREREIVWQLGTGRNTREIAESLCISTATVRNHMQHILEKLGAHNRVEVLAIAFHPGLRQSAYLKTK